MLSSWRTEAGNACPVWFFFITDTYLLNSLHIFPGIEESSTRGLAFAHEYNALQSINIAE
jgi:hypothetical protein